jgi:hypothetical protein
MVCIQRRVTALLLIPLTLFLIGGNALSQEKPAREIKVQNPRWALEHDIVVVTYDLVADSEGEYEISITLRRDSDKSFKIVPRSVVGAVGKGKFTGVNLKIRWEYQKDVPQGLSGEDYFFEFVVSPIEKAQGSSFLTYAAIAAGIGAVALAAVLIFGGSKASSQTSSQLPDPPIIR